MRSAASEDGDGHNTDEACTRSVQDGTRLFACAFVRWPQTREARAVEHRKKEKVRGARGRVAIGYPLYHSPETFTGRCACPMWVPIGVVGTELVETCGLEIKAGAAEMTVGAAAPAARRPTIIPGRWLARVGRV